MNFLDRLQQSFADFWEYIPALLGAAVVLLAGYLLAKLVQKGAARLLRRLHLNDVLKKGGVVPLDRVSTHVNPTLAIANLLFWLVMFSALLLAANALGFDSLAALFSELVGYIPAVVAAVVIIIVGIVLGDFVGGLIGASTISLHGGDQRLWRVLQADAEARHDPLRRPCLRRHRQPPHGPPTGRGRPH